MHGDLIWLLQPLSYADITCIFLLISIWQLRQTDCFCKRFPDRCKETAKSMIQHRKLQGFLILHGKSKLQKAASIWPFESVQTDHDLFFPSTDRYNLQPDLICIFYIKSETACRLIPVCPRIQKRAVDLLRFVIQPDPYIILQHILAQIQEIFRCFSLPDPFRCCKSGTLSKQVVSRKHLTVSADHLERFLIPVSVKSIADQI